MAEDQKINIDELDKELEEVNRLNDGYVDLDDPEKSKDEESSKTEQPPKEETPPEDAADDPSDTDEEEETPPASEEEEEESETPPGGKDEGPGDKPPVRRPERYIPIPKYQAEKKQWAEEKAGYEKMITDLKKGGKDSHVTDTQPGSDEEDAEIKAWAEENNMDEKAARSLIAIARKGMKLPDNVMKSIQQTQVQNEQRLEQEHFDNEYTGVEPSITELYPNASPAAKKAAKELMDKLSHTREYAATSLDYVLFKERKQFDQIMTGKKPAPNRVGPEQAGSRNQSAIGVKATDFKPDDKGRYDFTSLDAVEDAEKKNQIIKDLSPDAYMAYISHVDAEDSGVTVNRNGRQIKLK